MTKVALSGAGGQVGSVLRARLLAQGVALRSGGGLSALTPLCPAEEVTAGDLRDPEAVDRLLRGIDVLIHLAGTSVERPLPEIIENNLRALHEVYEGARRQGVTRIVFASSNHAFGMHPVTDKLGIEAPFRPDGFYGLSKAWGEDLARMYWDKHGIEGISVRIGSIAERPTEFRHLSTWFGYDDLTRMMLCCIEAREVGYLAVWGVSNNARSYWDNAVADRIAYRPLQNAEDYAEEILALPNPLDPVARTFQGGGFTTMDYTAQEDRPDRFRSALQAQQ